MGPKNHRSRRLLQWSEQESVACPRVVGGRGRNEPGEILVSSEGRGRII